MIRTLHRLVHDGRSDAPGPVVDALGRVGLVGYGVVHLTLGWLGLQIAVGEPNAPADATGAVGVLARTPGGVTALIAAALGLGAFAVWQLTAAAIGFRWVSGGERVRKRIGAVSKAGAVLALTVVIVDYLIGLRSASSSGVAASTVLALPAGRLLLGLAALLVLVVAGMMIYTGVRRTFMGDLDVRGLATAPRRAVEVLGVVGHLGRAAAFAVVGLLIGAAAVWQQPVQVGGLDGALRFLGSTGPGTVLLVAVAVGFGAFGVYCIVDAATRRA